MLIRTPSVNPAGDERAVAELLRARLTLLGITDVATHAALEARSNVLARLPGA